MKKRWISFYCITLVVFCQVLTGADWAQAITEEQKNTLVNQCDIIKDSLKIVQRDDSRTRVYLGRYYETILNKFITPLNVRLVENSMSTSDLIDNQNSFAKARMNFTIDYIEYQKALENLVARNCKVEPDKFYETLKDVRVKRKIVAEDTKKMRMLVGDNISLVNEMRVKI